MITNREQAMDIHIKQITWYSYYVDCFIRVLQEIKSGDFNYTKEIDIENIIYLLSKYSKQLKLHIDNMGRDWEFYEKIHKK